MLRGKIAKRPEEARKGLSPNIAMFIRESVAVRCSVACSPPSVDAMGQLRKLCINSNVISSKP